MPVASEQQRPLQPVLRQRAKAIADAWYRAIGASSSTSLNPTEIRQLVTDLTLQITGLLETQSWDEDAIDALAAELLSFSLPPRTLGTLQEVLVRELVDGLPESEMATLRTQSSRLIGSLTASLVRRGRALLLEELKQIRQAHVEILQRAQGEIREKDAMLRQQVDRLRALRQIDRAILAARSPREIGKAALNHVRELIPCRRASITLFDLELSRGQMIAGVPWEVFDLSQGEKGFPLTGWEEVLDALQREEVHLVDDILRLPMPTPMREMIESRPPRTHVIVPLRSEGELLGSLNLALENSEVLTDQGASVAQEVADSLAVAIRHAQLDAAITNHRQQLRALTARLAEIDEEERRTLTRALHDHIGQRLTALGINLNVIRAGLDTERAAQLCSRLDDSLRLLEETTDCVRRVMAELRPPMLDDYGLVPTLRWCGEQLASRTEVDVSVQGHEPDPRLPSTIEDALVRITQEALTNVAKHASASQVTVLLAQQGNAIWLTISDNGAGFDPASINDSDYPHWGLLTMSERAEAVGGRCHIESQPGEGTQVVVEVTR
jgi:signal transduction histidine kinase